MRILVIEDDNGTAQFIKKGFAQVGYAVDHAADGIDGLFMAENNDYDALVVDVMLPGVDGLSVVKKLRSRHNNTPIIMLSAKKTLDDRIRGLHSGSDDYLVKPFAFSELLARIQALLRRVQAITDPTSLTIEGLYMDIQKRRVFRDNEPIELQHREFALLEYLMRNSGRVVSKTMIMEHVWDYNFDPETNVVEARICRLRNKIDRSQQVKYIHTIRGAGYILEARSKG